MKHAIVKRANMKIAEQIGKRNPRTQQMEKIGMNKCDLKRGACEKKMEWKEPMQVGRRRHDMWRTWTILSSAAQLKTAIEHGQGCQTPAGDTRHIKLEKRGPRRPVKPKTNAQC